MQFEYMQKDNHTAVLTAIPQPEATISLPTQIGDFTITEIGTDVIPLGVKSIAREIILPDTITVIGRRAFNDLRYLKRLIIPTSVTRIEEFGIYTCPDLTELYIPSSVTEFGRCAFGYMYEHGRAYKLNYFTLLCDAGSAAEAFAKENDIDYRIIE